MRISFSFGGGPHRDRGPRHRNHRHRHHHRPGVSVSVPLGPVGTVIMSCIFIIIGIFMVLISFGNFIPLIAGIVFIIVGILGFKNGRNRAKYKRNDSNNLDE